ncbi:MAG: 50S ribosomal protein L10 [Candidatus Altiarchaeales archaeon]|nr:MAG: 50S ribosomal protein L10 [Candidatus Altiarchaeales archaeon]
MIATWKIKEVEELENRIKNAKVIGLVKISGIPSRQFQKIRMKLKNKATIRVTKNSLMRRALEKANMKNLCDYIEGSMGLIFTELDPFKLNKILEESRESAPAKNGDIAPDDIIVPKGETSLPPGPIIGELQNAGIKAKIDSGKIVVMEDSVLVKKGERIPRNIASVLTRLGIEPMEIGLELSAVYDNGIIYTSDILHIDIDKTIKNLQNAYLNAFNLSLNSGIYNKTVIKVMLSRAFTECVNLSINANIFNKESIKILLAKANIQMLSLTSHINTKDTTKETKDTTDNR